MPNPTVATFTVQLGPTVAPDVAAELSTWAELLGLSTSATTREMIEEGLSHLREDLATRAAARIGVSVAEARRRYSDLLPKHYKAAADRADTQVRRRRDYDAATRTPIAAVTPTTKPKRTRAKRTSA